MITGIKRSIRAIRKRLTAPASLRTCPVCRKDSDNFLEYGAVPRADARCPKCGSLERHRLFWLYLGKRTALLSSPPRRALHVAPEQVFEREFRSLIGEGYLTADLFADNVDVKMDITDIRYPDESFDFIYCSHVLEHVPDDRKAMREFHRVLAGDGIAVLLVPITTDKTFEDPSVVDPDERLRLFGQKNHVRRYGPDYMSRLKEEGFTVEKITPGNLLTKREIHRMAITRAAGELYICTK